MLAPPVDGAPDAPASLPPLGPPSPEITLRFLSLLPQPVSEYDPDELAEAIAEQLAVRWGVVFRDLLVRENIAVPWREILWAFRRLEARGLIRGGRFVNGFSGEQFAHPDAVEVLRQVRKQPRNGETIRLSAVDPLNLVGVDAQAERAPHAGHLVEGADQAGELAP